METSTQFTIPPNKCNSLFISTFDLSAFKMIETIEISDDNFGFAGVFTLEGMIQLQHLTIGVNSFTQAKYEWKYNKDRSFHILDCIKLETIEIGEYSFSDYSNTFELVNLPELRTLTIGREDSWSANFYYSSFKIQGNIFLTYLFRRSPIFGIYNSWLVCFH